MLEIKNTEIFGLERAIKASGNSFIAGEVDSLQPLTERDIKRAINLGKSKLDHQSHDSFLKGIIVQFDIKYPQYWTPEFQRYHFAEIVMSTSKMHRLTTLASKPFEEFKQQFNKYVDEDTIKRVQEYTEKYNNSEDEDKYFYFMKLLSNLPSGYELWMTCSLSYLQLKTIYIQRREHKLKEDWGVFCDWIETLPYMKDFLQLGDLEDDKN